MRLLILLSEMLFLGLTCSAELKRDARCDFERKQKNDHVKANIQYIYMLV